MLKMQYLKYKLTKHSDTFLVELFQVCIMNLVRIDSKQFQAKRKKIMREHCF